eukprot:SAG31_NODE_707_length_12684_cov_16.884863_4_plen_93_part_00
MAGCIRRHAVLGVHRGRAAGGGAVRARRSAAQQAARPSWAIALSKQGGSRRGTSSYCRGAGPLVRIRSSVALNAVADPGVQLDGGDARLSLC